MSGPEIPPKPTRELDDVLADVLVDAANSMWINPEDIAAVKKLLDDAGYVIISKEQLFWHGVNH